MALPFASCLASAQTPGRDPGDTATAGAVPTAGHYSFEVVSIRPSSPDTYFSLHRGEDGFRATGIPLSNVILLAYFPISLWSQERLRNAPSWISQNRYDINARVGQQDLDAWMHQSSADPTVLHAMLYTMLVERCHLQLHSVPAELPSFALTPSRHGALVRTSTPGQRVPEGMKLSDGGIAHGERLEDGSTTWHFYNASMASLADFLSTTAHTRILDQTGLTGRYDFTLTMQPDRPLNNHGEIMDPAIFWNLRALGLRTVPRKVSTVNVVIDHIEPPSEN